MEGWAPELVRARKAEMEGCPPRRAASRGEVDWGRDGSGHRAEGRWRGGPEPGGAGRAERRLGRAERRWGAGRGGAGARLPEQTQQLPAAAGGPRRAPQGEGGRRAVRGHHVAAGPAAAARHAVVLQAEAAEEAALRAALTRGNPPTLDSSGLARCSSSVPPPREGALGRPGGSGLF